MTVCALILICCGIQATEPADEDKSLLDSEKISEFVSQVTEKEKPADDTNQLSQQALNAIDAAVPELTASNAPAVAISSPDVKKATEEHVVWTLEHRKAIFEWQHTAGQVVFFLAVLIVVMGLIMSWRQFEKDFNTVPHETTAKPRPAIASPMSGIPAVIPPAVPGEEADDQADTEQPDAHQLEITASSAKVSTNVIGVIILTLSLAFFYLYLKFVFPIE